MDIDEFVKGLAEISYTPVTRIKYTENNGERVYFHPQNIPFLNEMTLAVPHFAVEDTTTNARIFIFEEFIYYGIVRINDNEIFMLGPIIEIPIDNSIATNLMKALTLPLTSINEFIAYYENTPHNSIFKLAQIIAFLCNMIHTENRVTPVDVMPEPYARSIDDELRQPLRKAINADFYVESVVKSRDYESELYSYIYAGQSDKLKEFLAHNTYNGETGTFSHSVMQQNKYLVITSIAIASRTAVQGGVNYNTAMQQSDYFIRKVDEARTFNELFDTHRQMLLTYTKLVAERKLGKPTPPLFLSKIQNYIERHLSERITTEEIATELNVNRSYLSTQFKKECGIDLGEYINRLKIDEAKRLLMTTDISLINIAMRLGFSSQSLFASVFKRLEGITPTEFQKKIPPR